MLHNAMKVNQDIDQIIEFCIKHSVAAKNIENMSAADLMWVQKLFRSIKDLKEYIEEEAKMMDTINEKLDKLLTSK